MTSVYHHVIRIGSKGSGKSRALGRVLVKGDVLAGVPGLLIDPAGGAIDNLLDALLHLPTQQQQAIWPRIVYIDAGNSERVMPFPLYYKLHPQERASVSASRFLEVVKMLDPNLTSAPVEGWNALQPVGLHTGAVLAALGAQITEAEHLLDQPHAYRTRIQALAETGQIERATAHWLLEELPALKPDLKARRLAAFKQKTITFNLNRPLRAMFGAAAPGIDWQRVIDNRQTVLLDLRHLVNLADQQFVLLWVLHAFLQFVKTRGIGRHAPFALTIDEISVLSMLDGESPEQPFAGMLDNLLNMWARQAQIWVTLSHQEAWQVSKRMFKTLLGCGTRIVGRTSDNEAALTLAAHLFPPDPHLIKRRDPVFDGAGNIRYGRPVTYSLDEQHSQAALALTRLGKFRFYCKRVDGEGGGDLPVELLDLAGWDAGVYPDDKLLAEVIRPRLHARTARPVDEILVEIAQRQQALLMPPATAAEIDGNKDAAAGQMQGPAAAAIVTGEQYDAQGYLVEPPTD